MHNPPSWRLLPVAALGLAAMACGAPARTANVAPEPAAPAAGTPPVSATVLIDSSAHPWSDADVEFMSGMIHHHAQAIEMSQWAPTHGAGESIRTLAGRIINAQRDEIRLMEQWLRDRGEAVPEPMPTGGDMAAHMHGADHGMMMPGMLTPGQMQQLDSARGKSFDELFLTFMIQHHRGAITMVKELFNTYGAVQDNSVFKLASDVNVDQTTEVARMTRMLFALKLEAYAP